MRIDPSVGEEIRRFEEQYRQNPDSLVFARLADAYRKAGEASRALQLLEAGVAKHRDYLSGHIVRARVLADLGREEEAIESFQTVLDMDSHNLVALRGLGDIAVARGDADEARHWFERLIQIDPENREATERLRLLEQRLGGAPPGGGTFRAEERDHAGRDEDSAPSRVASESAVDEVSTESSPSPDTAGHVRGVEPRTAPVPSADAAEGGTPHWWYEERSREQEGEDPAEADLLTRTMAELYAQQGLYEEALDIYEELLRDRPGDASLEEVRDALREAAAKARSSRRGSGREGGRGGESASEGSDAWMAERVPLGNVSEEPLAAELQNLLRAGEARAASAPAEPKGQHEPSPTLPAEAEAAAGDSAASSLGGGIVVREWLRRLKG